MRQSGVRGQRVREKHAKLDLACSEDRTGVRYPSSVRQFVLAETFAELDEQCSGDRDEDVVVSFAGPKHGLVSVMLFPWGIALG